MTFLHGVLREVQQELTGSMRIVLREMQAKSRRFDEAAAGGPENTQSV
ncbi:MAG: hypothetical protein L6R28_02170 [Planctomycetes bacterium]|nr:hypothetical protein [Planctomycetota bacterium]